MHATTDDATPADALPSRLLAARKTAGISQAEAARRANVTLRTWQRWETGATRAHFGHLPAMARALETTSEELLGATGEVDPRSLEDLRLEARLARIEEKLDALLARLGGRIGEPESVLDEAAQLLRQEGVGSGSRKGARSRRK